MKTNYPIGGFAPGNYSCICSTCDEHFIGDKRAVQCEACGINTIKDQNSYLLKKVKKLDTTILKLKEDEELVLICNRVNYNSTNRCITCGVKAGHPCGLQTNK
jgi:DNA-directed RNA polymerase subunit RPC12/RpoP